MSPIDASNIKHNISGWPKDSNSPAECAKECSNRRRCDTIKYDRLTKKCTLFENGKLSKDASAGKAGWCPKGEKANEVKNVEGSPLRCGGDGGGQVCKFPFKLDGEVTWGCVLGNKTNKATEREAMVCNTDQAGSLDLQEIVNKPDSSLQVCEECDRCTFSGVKYEGFGLKRHEGNNVYTWINTVEECQLLCQITEGCNFFNTDLGTGKCWLKHGVGVKKTSPTGNTNENFGAKYCSGDT